MSVISVAVIGKDGMPIVARQQAKIPAIKINSLFMSFSRLLEKNQKLSYIETPDVRYFYRPLDNDLNLVLVTDLNCNFLQHLELLNLLTKVLILYRAY